MSARSTRKKKQVEEPEEVEDEEVAEEEAHEGAGSGRKSQGKKRGASAPQAAKLAVARKSIDKASEKPAAAPAAAVPGGRGRSKAEGGSAKVTPLEPKADRHAHAPKHVAVSLSGEQALKDAARVAHVPAA